MTAKIIKKDNTEYQKSDFATVNEIYSTLVNKTLDRLKNEGIFIIPKIIEKNHDLGDEQYVLKENNNKVNTTNVMGFFGYKKERLIIKSRFTEDDSESDFFLLYLIQKVFEIPNITNFVFEANFYTNYMNLLIYMFPGLLSRAIKKGLFKAYVKEEMNDSNIKGTIDIARHIRYNTPFIGNVAYNKTELSYDNYVTELIRHTIEFIRTKEFGNKILEKVKDEIKIIEENTRKYNRFDKRKIINYNQRHFLSHAYYHEYMLLQKMCICILLNQKHQFGSGKANINGIIFDGAWLWEEYINKIIANDFYHPENKKSKGVQHLFTSENSKIGDIYPDFISKDKENTIIVDTKYKKLKNIGKGNNDYFQLLSYMFRFEAKIGFFIYPIDNENKDDTGVKELYLNRGSRYHNNVERRNDIRVVKIGFNIPNCKEYDQFVTQIEKSESELKRKINKYRQLENLNTNN